MEKCFNILSEITPPPYHFTLHYSETLTISERYKHKKKITSLLCLLSLVCLVPLAYPKCLLYLLNIHYSTLLLFFFSKPQNIKKVLIVGNKNYPRYKVLGGGREQS